MSKRTSGQDFAETRGVRAAVRLSWGLRLLYAPERVLWLPTF